MASVFDVRIPPRVAACNFHLRVNRRLLSNDCSVLFARQRDLTALLAAADNGHVEVFRGFLKHCACVVIAIIKCS